jgi:4-oxalocrotonate tautomerase
MPKLRARRPSSCGAQAAATRLRQARDDRMRGGGDVPNVTIEWLQGRTLDQKRKVIAGITDLLVDVADARREAVQVTFIDMSKEDWGRGGLLGIDRTDVHP